MSGGRYDYVYGRFSDFADSLMNAKTDPRRAAFKELLLLVTEAAHDIEWVDSNDYGPGDEHKAIDACFAFLKAKPKIITKAHAFDSLKQLLTEYFK